MATTTMISELIHTDNVFLFIPNIIGKHPAEPHGDPISRQTGTCP